LGVNEGFKTGANSASPNENLHEKSSNPKEELKRETMLLGGTAQEEEPDKATLSFRNKRTSKYEDY